MIEIVIIKDFIPYSEPLYETICSIENKQQFLEDFLKIECDKRFLDPAEIPKDEPVIRIFYRNNEYEFINYYGQFSSKSAYGKNLSLNREQFISLIEEYTKNDYEDIIQ